MRIGLVFETRTNEDVSRVEMAMWYKWKREEFRTGQTKWRVVVFFCLFVCLFVCLFFSLYVYFSYIFYFKETEIIIKEKQQKKNTKIYRHEEDKSLPILFDFKKQSSLFFVRLVLNLNQYPFVSFAIKGRELPRFSLYLFSYFFLLSPLLANNKSLSSLHLKWI